MNRAVPASAAAPVAPELSLLLGLLRAALSPSTPVSVPPGVDWKRFLALVDRHRVGAVLHQRAGDVVAARCPAEVATHLRAVAATTARRALAQAADQLALAKTLAAAGVDTLAVKGLVLAQRLYGGLGRRHVGDIDIFIRHADAARADAAIRRSGLVRFRPDIPLTPLQLKKFVQLKHEFEYRRDKPFLRAEILWRLEGLPETEEIWTRAVPAELGGQAVRTLPPDLDALYLLLHGARHGWFRLFWLVDAALLFRAPEIDWPAVMRRARELDLELPVLQAASLAEELLGIPRPAALQPAPSERRRLAALCAEARRQLARDAAEHEGLREWARQIVYRTRLQKRLRGKFAVVAPHLLTPESWRTLPLPDRWFFLYYPLTPFLWVWRRLRGPQA